MLTVSKLFRFPTKRFDTIYAVLRKIISTKMIQSSLEHGRIAIKLFHCRVLRGAVLLNKMFRKIHRSLNCFVLEIERSLRVSKIISQEHCSPHKLKENIVTQR